MTNIDSLLFISPYFDQQQATAAHLVLFFLSIFILASITPVMYATILRCDRSGQGVQIH